MPHPFTTFTTAQDKAFNQWHDSLTTADTHVFNEDGRGYPVSRSHMMMLAFVAGKQKALSQTVQPAADAVSRADFDHVAQDLERGTHAQAQPVQPALEAERMRAALKSVSERCRADLLSFTLAFIKDIADAALAQPAAPSFGQPQRLERTSKAKRRE